MAQVVIYSTNSCPFCTMAKRLLDSKGVTYETINVGSSQLWAEMEAKTGRSTVPQIYIGDHHVGGFDELSAADKRSEVDILLKG